jgi:hypothetical protein
MSPVRTWILNKLKKHLPCPTTCWSDTQPQPFHALTGLTHEDLMVRWHGPILDAATGERSGRGTLPTFTTYTSFLPFFASKVRRAGNLPLQKKNRFSGLTVDVLYHAFEQQTEPGWVPASSGRTPKPGDFFQCGTATAAYQVGVILEVSGDRWARVVGGAGGRALGRDGVTRTALEPHAGPVMGWVDVDVYFDGWDEGGYADLWRRAG